MKNLLSILSLAPIALLAMGCPITEENVEEVWETTQMGLTAAEADDNLDIGIGIGPGGLTLEIACPDGGNLGMGASLDIGSVDIDDSVSANLALNAKLQNCTVDDVTMNGEMSWGLDAEVDEGASLRWSWLGNITYSGKYADTCVIDMSGEAAADASGASLEYSGEICGFDAGKSLSVSVSTDDE